ncbi:pyridoxal-dependent decarboxylase [Flavobacterium aquatile]|uniref:Cytochrome D ubiquinol oxidase subunit I n=1 Tax=Flavobacterium aquatile LMG 4008 = ATCC 11947 TaxID=1453498 RepID=A0A095SR55_9FLAO|nr:pyridoxal-dependent decarboxylase [Flavobacterium aquatile]KGD67106.1 cytochrome D ubiquinol oxidase subunit I [Flavobacterium aquatile LMG 4008 = ATCC 11947]OXA66802.1 aspartate aminotransferase family protein [Flavobacterium aquatile LMG 4008 = ATCC 11947]GEC78402.1 cytochrome d ubiquinol oxidase subunit I [Flavobacterium aquatile]
MIYWKKLPKEERKNKIQQALNANVNFAKDTSLGYPASKLDGKVFYDADFLKDAPVLQTFVANPNHIGCHTLGDSESAFKGTHELEKEVLNVLAVDVFKAKPNEFDGYISPGGTEANTQAIWMYRNFFIYKKEAKLEEIVILASEDTHYSIPKAANLLQLDWLKIPVSFENREIDTIALEKIVLKAVDKGKKYFIVVSNMGTTMFGSVDNPEDYTTVLEKYNLDYKLHIDGAYGGFVYPFSNENSIINFSNPKISSITIDAHKMLQAPYGTGIFICRKNLIENVLTKEAQYVEGMDLTLCGSRSGANAIAVWMILFTYGPHKWFEKISVLQMRTQFLCNELDKLEIEYFREPYMNIVTIHSEFIPKEIAEKYDLVPETHNNENKWYKIVLMNHVEVQHLTVFIDELKSSVYV